MARWFFDVHVLAGLDSEDRQGRVPVIWRGDGQHIDVLVVERHAEILHTGWSVSTFVFYAFRSTLEQPRVGINQVGNETLFAATEFADMRAAATIDSCHSHADDLVSAQDLAAGFGTGDRERRKNGACGDAGLQELATGLS